MRGIYAAVFDRPYGDELVYVGSARVIEQRWIEHERKLRRGVHVNQKFQNAYNKYGKFRWEVLELLPGADEDTLLAREQFWYDKYLDERGKANLLNLMRPERNPLDDPEVRARQAASMRNPALWPEERRQAQAERMRERVLKYRTKRYIVTTPEGEQLEVTNLNAFCRAKGLHQSTMVAVAQGKAHQHKGYRVRYADEED